MSYRKSRFKHDIIEKRYDVSITIKTFKLNVRILCESEYITRIKKWLNMKPKKVFIF